MGKAALAALAAILVLTVPAVGAPSSQGLGPPDFKDRFVDHYDDADFCGTGETVLITERVVANVWDEGSVFRLTFNFAATFTYGDATIQDRWAGRVWDTLESGDQEGAHTHLVTHTGLRAFLKGPHGRVTRDAGNLQLRLVFEPGHKLVDVEILRESGPHPDFHDDAWCTAAVELLGIAP